MADFDKLVSETLQLDFVDVNMKNPESYKSYRQLLLQQHPGKREMSLPTYLLVSWKDGDCAVDGEIIGSMPKVVFRDRRTDG
jgi:hypothetical protein